MWKHPLYSVWSGMMTRCYNDKDPAFARYGAKGIKVCRRWHDVRNFVNDMERTYRKGLQIDRKNKAIRKSGLKRDQSSPASIMRMSVEMSAP